MENEIQVLNTEIVRDAQYESQVDIAKRYPRELTTIINNSIAIVTMDKETAETCNYTLPRAGKKISGASVHLARIIVQQYGNLRVESKVTGADRTQVHAEAVCFDLQSNVAVKISTSKNIVAKNGSRYNEDMILTTGKAAAAIAYRNAVLSVIPKAIVDKVYNAAMNKITGDLSTEEKLISRRKAAIDAFKSEYDVSEAELLTYLGLNTVNQIKKDEIVTMLGMFNSIKEGESTVDNMFDRKKVAETKQITSKEFDKLIKDLLAYNISLDSANKQYKDSGLTEDQQTKIKNAGFISEDRLDEIIQLVINEKKELNHFEFYLDDKQFNDLKNAVIDNTLNNEK